MTRTSSSRIRRHRRGDHGTSVVEYALIIAGAGLAMIGGVVVLGQSVKSAYVASSEGAEVGTTGAQDTSGWDYSTPATDPGATTDPSSVPSSLPSSTPTPSPTPTATQSATPTPTKTTATPTPTPTRPRDAISVDSGEDAKPVDIGVPKGARGFTATVDPEWAGDAYLDGDDELVFDAAKRVPAGTVVTVSWSYSKGGKLYEGSTTYWIT